MMMNRGRERAAVGKRRREKLTIVSSSIAIVHELTCRVDEQRREKQRRKEER